MKISDALMGLAKEFKLPCTKKYDGKAITLEMSQNFGQAKLGLDTTFTPSTSAPPLASRARLLVSRAS